jgi:hypothetical protein
MRRSCSIVGAVALGALVGHFATGGTLPDFLKPLSTVGAAVTSVFKQFGICGMAFGKDCAVHGDTIYYRGDRVRIAGGMISRGAASGMSKQSPIASKAIHDL